MEHVSVCIINFNGAQFLSRAIDSVLTQDHGNVELIVIDNASTDESRVILDERRDECRIILNDENLGYCAAANIGIAKSNGEYFICMNPDVFLEPDFITHALKALRAGEHVGAVSGKLLRYNPEQDDKTDIIDSTGIMMGKAYRPYDRGSGVKDSGQFDETRDIFGACGAAAVYKREFLEDVKNAAGECFDERFFAYKEDVDIAWRGRGKGWRTLFAPGAVAYHVRGFKSGRRRDMSDIVKYHSFKNRYLMLRKNMTLKQFLWGGVYIIPYEIALFGYALIFDRKLLKAYGYVLKNGRE